jgi:hypothetical protein
MAEEEVVEVAPESTVPEGCVFWNGYGDRIVDTRDLGLDLEDHELMVWHRDNGWMIDEVDEEVAAVLKQTDGQLRPPDQEQYDNAIELRKVVEAEQAALAEVEKHAEEVRQRAYDRVDESDSSSEIPEDATVATESDQAVIPDAGETVRTGTDA